MGATWWCPEAPEMTQSTFLSFHKEILWLSLVRAQAATGWSVILLSVISGQLHQQLLNICNVPDVVLGSNDTKVSEGLFGSCPCPLWLYSVSQSAGERGWGKGLFWKGAFWPKACPTLGRKQSNSSISTQWLSGDRGGTLLKIRFLFFPLFF